MDFAVFRFLGQNTILDILTGGGERKSDIWKFCRLGSCDRFGAQKGQAVFANDLAGVGVGREIILCSKHYVQPS